jgi:hypothetical protein
MKVKKVTLKDVFLSEDRDFWSSLGRWSDEPGTEEMTNLLKKKPPPRPNPVAPKINKKDAEDLYHKFGKISNESRQAANEIVKWIGGNTDYPEETTASIVYEFVRELIKDLEDLKRHL